jgi:hypothetical protein
VAVSLGKKGFIENHKKNKFSGIWRTVRALRADGPWVVDFYLIPEFLAKDFEKMRFRTDGPRGPGGRSARCRGRSVIHNRTRCCSVDRADGPRGPGGRSARPIGQLPQPLTSRFYHWNSNADSPRGHRGQSARHAFCS